MGHPTKIGIGFLRQHENEHPAYLCVDNFTLTSKYQSVYR